MLCLKECRYWCSVCTRISDMWQTAGLGGSVGCAVRLETRRSRVQPPPGGWSGGAKVLCILHHWGVQLILAYSWARPAILVVGKGRGGMFLFLLFLHFHSCSSFFPVPLFHLLYSLSSISFLPFSGRRHKMTLKGWRVVKPQHNQKSTPAEVGNILLWRLIMKYFLRSFSPFRWFKKGSCQFLAKECAQYRLTA